MSPHILRRLAPFGFSALLLLTGSLPAAAFTGAAQMEACVAEASVAKPEVRDPRDFVIYNCSTRALVFVYVSPSNDVAWGEDILGKGEWLNPGEYWEVAFNKRHDGTTCLWDIKVVAADGGEGFVMGRDLCATNVVTFQDTP